MRSGGAHQIWKPAGSTVRPACPLCGSTTHPAIAAYQALELKRESKPAATRWKKRSKRWRKAARRCEDVRCLNAANFSGMKARRSRLFAGGTSAY
ncbi:hypothetical protein KCP69_22975 [Salmonella enterica subsp. enterica]|nr:hypothetical protein KCP69_22975 [Salmonella enterica subsp. enterica]